MNAKHWFVIAASNRAAVHYCRIMQINPDGRGVTIVSNGLTAVDRLSGYRPGCKVYIAPGFPDGSIDNQEIVDALAHHGIAADGTREDS